LKEDIIWWKPNSLGRRELETKKITQNLDKRSKTLEYLQPGTKLEGRYKVLSTVGRGGMGAVYRAQDLRFKVEKTVAVFHGRSSNRGQPLITHADLKELMEEKE